MSPFVVAPSDTAKSTSRAFASLTKVGSTSRPWRTFPHRRRVSVNSLFDWKMPRNLDKQVASTNGRIKNWTL